MANPQQRRKARSSSHKPVKQSRRVNKLLKKQPPIKGPKVLQDAWDKHKTVRQNYAALGLAHSLTPTDSGGHVITHPHSAQVSQNAEASSKEGKPPSAEEARRSEGNVARDQTRDGKLPRGFGRIIRDERGSVMDVVLGEEEMSGGEEAAEGKGLEDFEIESPSRQPERLGVPPGSGWLLENNDKEDEEDERAKDVLRALEVASMGRPKKQRTSSNAEIKYLSRLVQTYGTNYEGMARDRRTNVNQYSAGQLRRAIERAKLERDAVHARESEDGIC
ncbi:uncharacterized protein FOMMEDRAFT_18040 [Fomitiporia mediterranea MF3/22]|uniref:uncharacterized protein n=1 Tax=Fomitiporia mediterranea (strain MF3/22) TaxID=694068 RepID=UPI0004407E0A|nr:uncharacterized protein FOMMEDRAFT_18040 [Fomitiporia mediterranea MF3/22]EJD05799.1 hypothetical protein FOMMEDRAFT_18040 [Fomitiporia mediterranea MF3/22]